jgi:hypothetical protein
MRVEATDEQTTFMIGGGIHRAAHGVEAARGEPFFRGAEQRCGDIGIVVGLEEAKESHPIAVEFIVRSVFDRSDSTNGCSVAKREEQLAVGRSVEWISPVKRIANSDTEWRNPLWMLALVIDLPWKIYEAAQVA